MEGGTRHISIAVPSMNSPRAAVARQSVQTALNRSVPAQGQGDEDYIKSTPRNTNKRAPSPRIVRTAPNGNPSAATNEFVGRTRTGPSRQTAKTSIVDFGSIPLNPRERMNVRGVSGFYPPLRMKSGGGSGKFAISETTVSTAWGPKSGPQENQLSSASSSSLQKYTVELSPNSDIGSDSVPSSQNSLNWLQRRNNEQTNNVANNSTPQEQGQSTSPHATNTTSPPGSHHTPPTPGTTGGQRKKTDAAWVRAFKVKQHRNNRYKEMEIGAKPTTNLDDGSRRWGLPD